MAGRSDDDETTLDGDVGADTDPVGAGADDGADDTDDDWRFGLDEVGDDGAVRSTVERETIETEHAVFVALGALAMVLVFVHLWTLV